MATKSSKPKTIDIRKTGPQSWKTLQEANNPYGESSFDNIETPIQYSPHQFAYSDYEQSPLMQQGDYWGSSMFDDETANEEDWQNNLQDIRANNQPWYAKLGAGITKGAALAGTTFIDGTLGLVAGIAGAVTGQGISSLWDNAISNTMAEWNKDLETILPNYRTKEEEQRPWYENLLTVNFWADSFIKNLGFTVGAFYSGNAWNKALKALGWVNGPMAAKGVGSIMSALNEGRIEANNNSSEFFELQSKQIQDATQKAANEILNDVTLTDAEKDAQLDALTLKRDELLKDAKEKADTMGLYTLIGNTVLLSLDNVYTFGKLYARGFDTSKGVMNNAAEAAVKTTRQAPSKLAQAAEQEAKEEAGKNVIKQGTHYEWKDLTTGRGIRAGLGRGLTEGNEEMAQAFIADTAGNYQSPDSPDAYYEALTNPEAQIKTKDFLTSVTEGFMNTYGNIDRLEEGAVGFLTGIFGTPTFGKVANSDALTYLGRGKLIGLSGGLFGEMSVNKQRNREGREAVETMNRFMDKVTKQKNYFVQSQAFTDAMSGFVEANDKFEFKNMEDNDDFTAISRFAQLGKLDDLKELVNQDYENMSDEELADIAVNTSRDLNFAPDGTVLPKDADGNTIQGGWRNVDGTLMSASESGKETMKQELIKKRDAILEQIDDYEDSIKRVRGISNNSLSEDQIDELAWLHWKSKQFEKRYGSLKGSIEGSLDKAISSLQDWENNLLEERKNLKEDLEEERDIVDEATGEVTGKKKVNVLSENDNALKTVRNYKKFFEQLKSIPGIVGFNTFLNQHPEYKEMLMNKPWEEWFLSNSGLQYDEYEDMMKSIIDLSRIAQANKDFNDRFKEFSTNPLKMQENRKRIDDKNEKKKKGVDKIQKADAINNMSIAEINKKVDDGDFDYNEFLDDDYISGVQELEGKKDEGSEDGSAEEKAKKKLDNAKKVRDFKKDVDKKLNKKKGEILDAINAGEISEEDGQEAIQSVNSGMDLLQQAYESAESVDDMEEAVRSFAAGTEDVGATDDAEAVEALSDLGGAADEILNAIAEVKKDMEDVEGLPTAKEYEEQKKELEKAKEEGEETPPGHDVVATVKPENERKKAKNPPVTALDKARNEAKTKATNTYLGTKDAIFQSILSRLRGSDKGVAANLLEDIESYIVAGLKHELSDAEILDNIKGTQSYAKLMALGIPMLDTYISNLIRAKREELEDHKAADKVYEEVKNKTNTTTSTPSTTTNDKIVDEVGEPTPDISNAENLTDDVDSSNGTESKVSVSTQEYWFPTLSFLPIHVSAGQFTPFYKIARTLKDGRGNSKYSAALLKRIEAVGEYLDNHGAFERVSRGEVQGKSGAGKTAKAGTTIYFTVDEKLNEDAGEFVILMTTDSSGSKEKVVGDVMSENDFRTSRTANMRPFIEEVKAEYAKWKEDGGTGDFVFSKSTTADKTMIGKVPYTETKDRRTLNEVHTSSDGKQIPFKLGIKMSRGMIMTPGRKTSQGRSAEDDKVMNSLTGRIGQPYLLMPTADKTGKRQYIPVPFLMPTFSNKHKGTAMHTAVTKVFEQLFSSKPAKVMDNIMNIRELLSLQELHINYDEKDPTLINISIKRTGDTKQTVIYRGKVNNDNAVSTCLRKLEDLEVPYQISRKYINTTYKDGNDYNRMIGELANINLAQGSTHTISDWFTIIPVGMNKAKSPKTLKENPGARSISSEVIAKGTKISIPKNLIGKNDEVTEYTIVEGNIVYDSNGKVVKETYTRNKVFGYQAVKEGKAVVVENRGKQYIVDGNNVIISWTTGKIMEWTDKSTQRQEILDKVKTKLPKTAASTVKTKDSVSTQESTKYPITEVEVIGYGGVTRKEKVQVVPASELKEGDMIWYSGSTINNSDYTPGPHHLADVEGIVDKSDGEDVAGWIITKNNGLINPAGRTFYRIVPQTNEASENPINESLEAEEPANESNSLEGLTIEDMPENAGLTDDFGAYDFASIADEIEEVKKQQGVSQNEVKPVETSTEVTPTESENPQPNSSTTTETTPTRVPVEDIAKANGLLNSTKKCKVWAALSPEQKVALVKGSKIQQKQLMQKLEFAFNSVTNAFNEKALKGNVDTFLKNNAKYRRSDNATKKWNAKKERRWLKKVLPKLSDKEHLRIKKGLIKIADGDNPGFAYGQFQNAIITIASNAASGTLFHEAFHAVVDCLLNDQEYFDLFETAREKYGNYDDLTLEENLAEDFRRYVQLQEKPVIGKFVKVFRTLKHIVQNLFGKELYINKLFYNISRGKLSRQQLRNSAIAEQIAKYNNATSDVITKINAEMQSIKQKAIADGTFMKAPNGKPTNLTERQWLQVRTKAFKDWFGDWENDPTNASKIVDKNGEPLVVYHGSPSKNIRVFDASKAERKAVGSQYSELSDQMNFFVSDKDVGDVYSETQETEKGKLIPAIGKNYAVFLNIKNPKTIDFEGKNWNGAAYEAEFYDAVFKEWVPLQPTSGQRYFSSKGQIYKAYRDTLGEFGKNKAIEEGDIRIKETSLNTKSTNEEAEIALKEGYDGIIIKNVAEVGGGSEEGNHVADDYVTFNTPNQIKSATDNIGTFLREDDDIRYSMIGIEGAKRLDEKFSLAEDNEEATTRMDNLSTAVKMEKENKSAIDIKMATGWERGADDKWRYEIPDITLHGGVLYNLLHNRKYTDLPTLLGASAKKNSEEALKNAEQLFKAYPKLAQYKVTFQDIGEAYGSADNTRHIIRLNPNTLGFSTGFIDEETLKRVERTLVHEIQHAIQAEEGFAKGGNPNSATQAYLKESGLDKKFEQISSKLTAYQDTLDKIIDSDEKFKEIEHIVKTVHDIYFSMGMDAPIEDIVNTIKKTLPNWVPGVNYDALLDERKQELIVEHEKELEKAKDLEEEGNRELKELEQSLPNGIELYARLAGEVEARTVSARHNMSVEEMHNSLFMDDLYKDVAKKDLIFIYDNISTASSVWPVGFKGTVKEFQEIVDSNINNPTFRWRSRVAKNNKWGRFKDDWFRHGYDVKGYVDKMGNWKVSTVKPVQPKYREVESIPLKTVDAINNSESTIERINRIRQHHRDKLLPANLSEEDKQYLRDRKISMEDYNKMTDLEKEVLFKCKE